VDPPACAQTDPAHNRIAREKKTATHKPFVENFTIHLQEMSASVPLIDVLGRVSLPNPLFALAPLLPWRVFVQFANQTQCMAKCLNVKRLNAAYVPGFWPTISISIFWIWLPEFPPTALHTNNMLPAPSPHAFAMKRDLRHLHKTNEGQRETPK
jgi:hypothetical protein